MKTKNKTRKIATVGRLVGKPWLACSTDDMRHVLNHVFFKDGKLYAANGHIAICQDLQVVHNFSQEFVKAVDGKMIHREALEQINKFNVILWKEDGIHCTKNEWSVLFKYSELDGKFPSLEKIIPKEVESIPSIVINPALMTMLGKVLYCCDGTRQMKMRFHGKSKPIMLSYQSIPTEHQWALLMPVLLGGAE